MKRRPLFLLSAFAFLFAGLLFSHGEEEDVSAFPPPSRYIGFYDEYLGFQNGCIPEATPRYTGPWRLEHNGRVLLEGHYTNGYPSGEWREFAGNDQVRRLCVYGENGAFEETAYFPDGKPRHVATGRCFYDHSRVMRQIHSLKRLNANLGKYLCEPEQTEKFPDVRLFPCFSGFIGENGKRYEYHFGITAWKNWPRANRPGNDYLLRVFQQDADTLRFWAFLRGGTLYRNDDMPESYLHTTAPFFSDVFFTMNPKHAQHPSDFEINVKLTTVTRNEPPPNSSYPVTLSRSVRECLFYADKKFLGDGSTSPNRLKQPPEIIYPASRRIALITTKSIHLETGVEETFPFHLVCNGYYIPGDRAIEFTVNLLRNYPRINKKISRFSWQHENREIFNRVVKNQSTIPARTGVEHFFRQHSCACKDGLHRKRDTTRTAGGARRKTPFGFFKLHQDVFKK